MLWRNTFFEKYPFFGRHNYFGEDIIFREETICRKVKLFEGDTFYGSGGPFCRGDTFFGEDTILG